MTQPFGAAKAFLTLVLFLGAQCGAGIVVGTIAVVAAMATGAHLGGPAEQRELMRQLGPWVILGSAIGSTILVGVLTRAWAWHLVRDRTPSGLGLTIPSWQAMLAWACAGAATAGAYLAVIAWLVPFKAGTPLGPLAQMATAGGWARAVWAVAALLIAPPVEELLFRGLLFRGFAESWGAAAAGIVVTVLFVALHLFETIHYWPATLAVLGLAIATLLARLRSGSVVAAMAVHTGYNAVVVLAVCAAAWKK